ncbi:DUF4180 domain-containing protein [Streptomyces sp. 891-h]|uniref:DUF4180 domain-containing protein n=1 Tax=unclassified Streptomyces TaxID=2593676 RepID=UPI001FAAEFE9|nr:DUF4180 domain-containing protein [Streptomyces sp. 891-h]UNZ16839.1 DUF4180 domain-containing protein [Streptomyces sp. 891-h]
MSSSGLETINGVTVLIWDADGETIGSESDALDVIGNTSYQGAEWAVIPASRLDEAFFRLRTRLAGDVVQKFVQYGLRLAVVGDISRQLEASSSLRDFVRECNRGQQTWFLTDVEELRERLRG